MLYLDYIPVVRLYDRFTKITVLHQKNLDLTIAKLRYSEQ